MFQTPVSSSQSHQDEGLECLFLEFINGEGRLGEKEIERDRDREWEWEFPRENLRAVRSKPGRKRSLRSSLLFSLLNHWFA